MPTVADRIAATVAGLRPRLPGLAFPDAYELVEDGGSTRDTRGNRQPVETSIEAGVCLLKPAGMASPQERAIGERVTSSVPYVVLLPYETEADADHTLVVNGARRFNIVGVLRTEGFGALASAVCTEQG